MPAPPPHDPIDRDAVAEAFNAWWTRVVVTAADERWLAAAVSAFTGYGTSVIGCDAEVGVERSIDADQSPDGRAGVSVMAFGFRSGPLGKAMANRVGQTLLTCPTVAVFDGEPDAGTRAPLGDQLRYFGDGYETRVDAAWSVPVMEGEVTLPATVGVRRGVAGGNLVFGGSTQRGALAAAEAAVDAIAPLPRVITPFPGGVCRSGSKAGSRHGGLVASTNEACCPTLRGRTDSRLPAGVDAAYEVVINGADEAAVRRAMRVGVEAAVSANAAWVTACEYGGKLGRVRIPLRELVDEE